MRQRLGLELAAVFVRRQRHGNDLGSGMEAER
jgi:hypothetical protein